MVFRLLKNYEGKKMVKIKKILNIIGSIGLAFAGVGLLFRPDEIIAILCPNKVIFGIFLISSATLLMIRKENK